MSSVTSGNRLPKRSNVVFREPSDPWIDRLIVALVVVVVVAAITWGPTLVEILLGGAR